MLEETGCAAVAVGRAALGYPWAFGDILRGAPRPLPGLGEVVDEIAAFAADARLALGDGRACGYMRKFYPWYLAGHDVRARRARRTPHRSRRSTGPSRGCGPSRPRRPPLDSPGERSYLSAPPSAAAATKKEIRWTAK